MSISPAPGSELGDELPVAAFYDEFREKRGLDYGPSFRGIERLWGRNNKGLGRLRLPEALLPDAVGCTSSTPSSSMRHCRC